MGEQGAKFRRCCGLVRKLNGLHGDCRSTDVPIDPDTGEPVDVDTPNEVSQIISLHACGSRLLPVHAVDSHHPPNAASLPLAYLNRRLDSLDASGSCCIAMHRCQFCASAVGQQAVQ